MNLVNELIKDLLPEEEKQTTTAVYAGGFKPPTSGHFEVVQQALKENPEIDEFIIFIGAKERDGISQDESLLIWEIYNNYLPFKVKIEPTSKPPIRAVYDYAKNHPTREVLWVIGAREGNEEDFKDITSRTSSISKYPNLELRTIITAGGVSGTAARNAAKVSFEKFEKFIPDVLSPEEKQEAYNLVSGKIQEIGDLSQQPYSWEFLPNNSDRSTKVYRFEAKDGIQYEVNLYYVGSYADVDGRFEKGDWSLEFLAKAPGIGGYSSKALTGGGEPLKIMSTVVDITKDFIKDNGNVGRIVYTPTEGKTGERDAKDNIRGKLYKAIIQKSFPKAKISGNDNTAIIVDVSAYSTEELQEVGEANVSPYKWKETKKTSYSVSYEFTTDSGVDYLVKFTDNDDDEDISSLDKIRDWDISFFSKSKIDSDGAYAYSSSQVVNKGELFKVMSTIVDITKDVIKNFPNTEKLSFQPSPSKGDDTVDNQRGRLYKAFIAKQLPQAKVDQEGSTVTINLPEKVPLNENASYTTTINITEKIAQLTNHMIKKGMNVEPLPTVEFIDGDTENAKNFLGKTAYYDPERKHIVLYTEGRHPKDIVRSYAHEMIHHIQNLEGRLGNINTTNTMEDDNLNNLEAEANLKGTMTFRNWTDSIQENKKKDPFGLNAYAQELARLREDILDKSKIKIYLDMDGVLADFNQRFRSLAGMEPDEFESKYGKTAFWDFIDEGDNKIRFWVGIPVLNGAKELVDIASKYNYSILTAPSAKKQSRLGKNLWIKKYTGDLFPSKPSVIFKKASEKHLVKPELTKNDILIDDRQSTIDNWNTAGGTGIFYKNISQVLNDLGKLGL